MLRSMFYRLYNVITHIAEDLSLVGKSAAVALAFIAPIHTMLIVMVVFVLLDMLSAVYLSYKQIRNRTQNKLNGMSKTQKRLKCSQIFIYVFKPERFWETIEKLFAYPVVLTACYVFDCYVLGINPTEEGLIFRFSVTNLAFVLIVLMDFKSFLRNMGKATDNEGYRIIEGIISKKFSYFRKKSGITDKQA